MGRGAWPVTVHEVSKELDTTEHTHTHTALLCLFKLLLFFEAQLLFYVHKSFYISNYKLLKIISFFYIEVYNFLNMPPKYFTDILC